MFVTTAPLLQRNGLQKSGGHGNVLYMYRHVTTLNQSAKSGCHGNILFSHIIVTVVGHAVYTYALKSSSVQLKGYCMN